jgi:uncharacterized protein YprB with RNaseH-like and TPR domain
VVRTLPLYGLDIETDTSLDGLDPGVAGVIAIAVSTDDGDTVLTGSESAVLIALDGHLADLDPGVVVTWNGAAFDLPFLADRAARHGVDLGLEMHWDPRVAGSTHRRPLPGHIGSYVASWYDHSHLDAYRAWRTLTADPDESCALKAVAAREGLPAVEIERSLIHETGLSLLRRYASSDAALARRLAERRWNEVRRFIDRLPNGGQLALGYR